MRTINAERAPVFHDDGLGRLPSHVPSSSGMHIVIGRWRPTLAVALGQELRGEVGV